MPQKVFISYAHEDREFARLLDAGLSAAGVEAVRDERELRVGDSIPEWIYRSIAQATAVVYVLSASSVQSAWAREELSAAQTRQRVDARFTVAPVLIDDVALPNSLTHVYFADFRLWRSPDGYRVAMMTLLASLGIEVQMLEGGDVEWWLARSHILRRSYGSLMIAFGYVDAAVGWSQWFTSVKWASKELKESEYKWALAAISEAMPAACTSPRMQALDEALQTTRACSLSFDTPDLSSLHLARDLWVSLGRLLAMLAELETEALVVLRATVQLPSADGHSDLAVTASVSSSPHHGPVTREDWQASDPRPSAVKVAAEARSVLDEPDKEPDEADIAWARWMTDRSASNHAHLAQQLAPVVAETLASQRRALENEIGRQLTLLAHSAADEVDSAQRRFARATIEVLRGVTLPTDTEDRLMEAAIAASARHPVGGGCSVTLTARHALQDVAGELRRATLQTAYATVREKLAPTPTCIVTAAESLLVIPETRMASSAPESDAAVLSSKSRIVRAIGALCVLAVARESRTRRRPTNSADDGTTACPRDDLTRPLRK